MSIALSFILMFFIPTTTKIFDDKDVFLILLKGAQWIGFLIVFVAALFFSRWGYKSYQKITDAAALLLEDIKLDFSIQSIFS
ncbi:hypothetical protein [Maribacter antarcticus]|uniref:hypothetical protein n=1 Tax=Maribacter antarcticus TaxID=505250 RepID=UPI00047A12F4|nr:hypothetical protein [Maribacter antarcticus]